MGTVLTLEAWNRLLDRINSHAQYPPPPCDPVAALSLVSPPHKWSASDIQAARAKLSEICSNNVFSAPSTGRWRRAIIDELEAAIDNGWCNCEEEERCCIPDGSGTVQINPGGYYVTIPFAQIVEQYLYGNVSYSALVAALGANVVARLQQCVGSANGQIIHYALTHLHWTNCIYEDRWVDSDLLCFDRPEYWFTCSNTDYTLLDQGYVPAFTPGYQSSTSVGSHNYFDQRINTGLHYDYGAQRYYYTWWTGAFDVDSYVYTLRAEYSPNCPK